MCQALLKCWDMTSLLLSPALKPKLRAANRCLVTMEEGKGANYRYGFAMEEEAVSVCLTFSLFLFLHVSVFLHVCEI